MGSSTLQMTITPGSNQKIAAGSYIMFSFLSNWGILRLSGEPTTVSPISCSSDSVGLVPITCTSTATGTYVASLGL